MRIRPSSRWGWPRTVSASLALWLFFVPQLVQSQTVAPVSVSAPGGKYAGSLTLSLSCPTSGASIRYTTDGSIPTATSPIYTAPLTLTTTTPLRARAFKTGQTASTVATHTYFFGLNHTFPVVSLVFEDKDFFDPATGIYANPDQNWERRTNIELFENQAQTAAFNHFVETEIQGTGSAQLPQKSLDIKPKNALGSATLNYRIFPDLPFDQYRRLVLRNGGQDWNITMFRDEFVTDLVGNVADLGGILQKPALDLQAWRPAVAYFNGQYWGIHNLRERMNRFYVEQHYGYPEGSFDMIENYSEAISGDSIEWFRFIKWVENTDFTDDSNFANLLQRIDYQNYLDYCALYVYIDNQDWPGNNVRRFRERKPDAKWRWICFDFDFTLGLFQPGAWNTGDASPDALARLLMPNGLNWPNPDWSTLLFRKCWENARFRRDFGNRMADFMNTIFAPARFGARLDGFTNLYRPEIERHFKRWTSGFYEPFWLDNIEKTRSFGAARPQFVRGHVAQNLPEVTGSAAFTVSAAPKNGGTVRVSTITLAEANFPWTGTYFTGLKIPVKAVAAPGFVFKNWSDASLGTADSVAVTLAAAKTLTAIFAPLVPPCSLTATVGAKTCNPNGTLDAPGDDLWSFVLNVNGLNASTTWQASIGGHQFSGLYGVPKTVGQFAIAAGPTLVRVRDANDAACTVQFDVPPPPPCSGGNPTGYCASRSIYPWHDWISSVSVGNLTKHSQKNTYSNFSSLSANLPRSQSIPVSLRANFSATGYDEFWRIWIDWNRNGQFEAATEKVFERVVPAPASGVVSVASGSFSVPSNAPLGTTRMRVSMKRDGFAEPCETFNYGEVEDYSVVVVNFLTAPGGPRSAENETDALENPGLWPNPAGAATTLFLKNWAGKNVRVQLLNPLGVALKTWETPALAEPFFALDLSGVPPGQYFVLASAAGERQIERKLVVH
ncbi:MAG: CotH kinase family protein [Saprospiraceae bacterium]